MKGPDNPEEREVSCLGSSSPPCIFDLCLQLHRSGKISQTFDVTALPGCVGCGACATLCPASGITIEDRQDERVISVSGEVVVKIKMDRCQGCGVYHVPILMVEQVAKLAEIPRDILDKSLCARCKRIAYAAALTGNEPDFARVRSEKP